MLTDSEYFAKRGFRQHALTSSKIWQVNSPYDFPCIFFVPALIFHQFCCSGTLDPWGGVTIAKFGPFEIWNKRDLKEIEIVGHSHKIVFNSQFHYLFSCGFPKFETLTLVWSCEKNSWSANASFTPLCRIELGSRVQKKTKPHMFPTISCSIKCVTNHNSQANLK